ncbi:MAG: hypothetical protein P4M12_03690 [Gammaproteobacteria bacterium]|nr:hypothetical protein [Gammaproteobacteria bacterium]
MKKPVIIGLNDAEREAIKKRVSDNNLDDHSKEAVLNIIDFTIELQRQLKEAKISMGMLRKMFGSDSEVLKKLLQTY